ncbi:MAG: hypothetical protein WBV61_13920 [Rhodanobacteraceae bacterium]
MNRIAIRSALLTTVFSAMTFAAGALHAADVYDAAVAHSGRSASDLKRDATDKPATVLRFAGIKPGMRVLDFLAADGYYSEILSYIVGAKGHVILLNNAAYDAFSNNGWRDRIGHGRLPNVEHRTVDPAHMDLAPSSLDAVIMIKVYHDLYWVSPSDGWPKIEVGAVLDQLAHALKPGGLLLVVDHSAKPGSGNKDAGTLHRIDETYARKDFEAHGFEFLRASDALRNPSDQRDRISYKPPMIGKTDRFMLLFRKHAG